ncbi:GTPase HflX [Caldicellulosiruptor changbaiensis]|uniref:GTPase HflX n=1 Tax=Caldicellulosiruptor changbaiensis TaxID=1222016 RepID=A0A3T0DAA9_9FIRM|nr:GTPase HflX [Caldicellulosiruptor changbaiensis]AZT91682.1 GTPase HflX [Caldicellulosiruptor changbaiensis]
MIQKLKSHKTEEYMIDEFVYNTLKEFSLNLNKEIAIVLNRKGRIEEVLIEKKEFAELENQDSFPKKAALIFTRLSSASHPSMLDLSILIMKKYDYVMIISLKTEEASIAFWGSQLKEVEMIGQHRIEYFYNLDISSKISEVDEKQREREKIHEILTEKEERALLVDVWSKSSSEFDRHLLEELESLCKTAGVKVVDKVVQVRRNIDPAYFIGRGKAEEIFSICQQKDIDVVIFNRELSPAQIKNLEELLLRKVIDRTDVILDIFARRARTREGKLQVELAQLLTLLPRLRGTGVLLSRLGGGIGTRGPGETKLEIDRRHIQRRIEEIKKELEKVKKSREVQRKSRIENQVPVVSIIGYTNAGKSTLMNRISKADVLVEDKLFATLDTTTRRVYYKGKEFLLTDTVGFIRNLPHHLVEAFSSTLEEVKYSNLILNVVDISDPYYYDHIKVSEDLLKHLGAENIPLIRVYNKIDKVDLSSVDVFDNLPHVFISAQDGRGIDTLLDMIVEKIKSYDEIC